MATATRSTRVRFDDEGPRRCPHRGIYLVAATVIAVAGLDGSVQLVTGTFTPPVSDLEPLGLDSWVLPGLWLFASVVIPWSVAAWATARRWRSAPAVVLTAAGLLVFELGVQIPFLGFSPFQPIMGALALALGLLARHDLTRWSTARANI